MATQKPIAESYPLRWDAIRQLYVATKPEANYLAALVNKHGPHLEGVTEDVGKAHIQYLADQTYDGEQIDWLALAAISASIAGI